ncbi:pyrophosphohydrolase domain-containing protein [Flavobacterium sp. GNP002]
MKKLLAAVRSFQKKFKQPISKKPMLTGLEEGTLRFELMKEENEEYLEAVKENDLVGVADALGDQLYILLGTINHHGMHNIIEKVFYEIQDSNMSKLGADGQPIYREDGKVLKGPNYFEPNLKQFL